MDQKGTGILGFIIFALCIAAAFVLRGIFPALAKLIFWLFGIAAALVAAVVILVIVLAFRKGKNAAPGTGQERPEEILSRGRRNVMEIRSRALRLKNGEMKELCANICDNSDKILQTLKQQPEDIPDVRKVFNYYLPTLGSVLDRYVRIEQSGVPSEDMTKSAITCLRDISSAMERQYQNLFTDEIFDLTVEMELMTMMCRRDGLITGEDPIGAGGETLGLRL